MAKVHGKDSRVYLGSRDVSGDLSTMDVSESGETHDVTVFSNSGFRSFDSGLAAWEATFAAFYQTNVGTTSSIERQLEDLLGINTANATVMSLYLDSADGIGDIGYCFGDANLTKFGIAVTIGDIVKVTGSLQGRSSPGMHARLLHPLGADSSSTNQASYDNAASSSAGGRSTLHITAATGTGGVVKIQHSADNSVWVDLCTYTTAAAVGSQTLAVTGTVNRYLRAISTINATSSLTFVTGFARF